MKYSSQNHSSSMPKTTIVVLGTFRSGTSATSRVLSCLGVDFGPKDELIGPNIYNPVGHYQRSEILHANNRFIESAGSSVGNPAEPPDLLSNGDQTELKGLDLGWAGQIEVLGLKDPRFCATLLAWLELGILKRASTKIVHVTRGLITSTKSARRYPIVAGLALQSKIEVGRMILRYNQLAQWHVDNLKLPVISICFEELSSETEKVVRELANFVGCNDLEKIQSAIISVGKRKAKFAFFARHPIRYILRWFRRHILRWFLSFLRLLVNYKKRRANLDHFFKV